jgi:hypothetical protein
MAEATRMKKSLSWLGTAFITLLMIANSKCFAQTTNAAVISNAASVTNLQGLGVNVGQWTYWGGSADYLQNILANPGFEPSTSGRVVTVPTGVTSTAFCDNVNYYSMPSGFYNGATFEDIYETGSGATAVVSSRGTGTITAYNPTGCASSTPQFTYSASFTIQAGDYVRFHAAGNAAGESTYAPAGWWNSDSDITLVSDKEPNSSGIQALEIGLNGSSHTITEYQDAQPGNYTGAPSNFIKVAGSWTVSCWAKAVSAASPALNLSFGRVGSTYFNQTFTPTSSWAQYSNTFTGPETTLTSNINTLQFQITGSGTSGNIRVDDCFVGPTTVTTTSWSNDLTSALKALNPGFLRDQQSGQGNSYANFVANDTARGFSSQTGPDGGWQYSVDEFFKLNAAVGSTPWIIVPVALTDSELQALGSYLASEEATYNFPQIIIEWGNEMWNAGQCGGVCYSTSGDLYPAIGQRDFNSILTGAGANSSKYLKWVAAGQYGGYPPYTGQLAGVQSAASAATYIAGAPYYLNCLDTQTSVTNDMLQLFDDENLEESYMQLDAALAATTNQSFAVYEGGPSTWWGSASNSERNAVIAGAASAATDAELVLNLWTAGTPVVNLYDLAQTNFTCSGSSCPNASIGTTCTGTPPSPMSADMWGIVHDLPTPLMRPRGLAFELLNQYLMTSKSGSFYPASSNTYSGVTVGAWHDSHNAWDVAIVNSNSTAQNIVVQFPTTTGLPTGTVKQVNYTSSITDTNESSALVSLGNGGKVVAGPTSSQVTIPVPAYGLVVAEAAVSTATATPTSSPTATPTPAASATPTPSPTPTADPPATPTPTSTPTPSPTKTPSPTPTAKPSATPTPTSTPTPTLRRHRFTVLLNSYGRPNG